MKIIKIIGQTKFIIDAGKDKKIEPDNRLKILGEQTIAITDPDSGSLLENVPTYKGIIVVKEVFNHVSICQSMGDTSQNFVTFSYEVANNPAIDDGTAGIHPIELNVNQQQVEAFRDHDDSPIQLGDEVVITTQKDYLR